MPAELTAQEVSGNVVAIYPGRSRQSRNSPVSAREHIEALLKQQHVPCFTQAEHPHFCDNLIHESSRRTGGKTANEKVVIRDDSVAEVEPSYRIE